MLDAFSVSVRGFRVLKSTYRLRLIEKHLGKTLRLGDTFYHIGKHLLIESLGHRERFRKMVELGKL
jgi:hypothetical protein